MMLQLKGIDYHIGARELLRDVNFVVNPGEKAGLVGVNGAGKSTLLRIIMGELKPDSGEVTKPQSVGYMPQSVTLYGAENTKTVQEFMASATGLDALSRRLQQLTEAMNENPSNQILIDYGEVLDAFESAGGWEAEATMSKFLAGLGLDFIKLTRRMATLSGGQKTRVALARLLLVNSDLLMLDEPTNHLDTEAKLWLMDYLASFKGALLIVSHDLQMLDKATDKILYLSEFDQTIHVFRGNYTSFVEEKQAMDEHIRRTLKVQRHKIDELRESAYALLGAGPKRASQGKSILRRAERMEQELPDEPRESRTISIDFSVSRRSGDIVLKVRDLTKWYGNNEVVKPLGFTMTRTERWAVIGVNGAGKTTLLKMLSGLVEPTGGAVETGSSVDIGYYAQEHEELNPALTVLKEARLSSTQSDGYLRSALAHFLFQGDDVFKLVRELSGGERSRLALCKLVLEGHNLLLLDEPTNNLDSLSSDKLVEALRDYEGTMLFVSHNLAFLQRLRPTQAILMPEAKTVPFDEDVYDRVERWE